ncbi:MAG: hypothetical protein AB9856_03850 [Cellulosilyticaceae bacterium]
MNYYIIVDTSKNILQCIQSTLKYDYTEITCNEYEQAKYYNKFDTKKRQFFEEKIPMTSIQPTNKTESRLEQIESAVGELATLVAKNTLLK